MTPHHRLAVVVATVPVLVLGACAGGTDEPQSTSTTASAAATAPSASPAISSPAPASPSASRDAGLAFCAELKANGATGADFGAVGTPYPKEMLLKDVRGKLASMGDARPPEEIADEWKLRKTHLVKVEAAAKRLKAGARLTDTRLYSTDKLRKAQDTLIDYWFATCG